MKTCILAFVPIMGADPQYLLFVMLPGLVLAMWAQFKVRSAYNLASRHVGRCGLSGAETARRILDMHGIHDVEVDEVRSFLGDHYDPRSKVLRLSPDVYHGRSLAALGIAAHEVGHAVQHAVGYAPLAIRNNLVPAAVLGTNLSFILILAGLALQPFRALAFVGVGLFTVAVLFQLITLPVEFDASRRARAILTSRGIVTAAEDAVVGKVLNAAAMTYLAAAITAVIQLLYYVSLLTGRRSD